jgi:hypothetical protein
MENELQNPNSALNQGLQEGLQPSQPQKQIRLPFIIALVMVVSIIAASGGYYLGIKKSSQTEIRSTFSENQVAESEVKLTGTITEIDDSCNHDGVCKVKIDEYWIITELGGDPTPEMAKSRGSKGTITDPDGSLTGNVGIDAVGQQAEVYAKVVNDTTLTLYGKAEYYLKIKANENDARKTVNPAAQTKVISLVTMHRSSTSGRGVAELRSDNIMIGTLEEDYIYLRFDEAIMGNESLENFQKYLRPEGSVVHIMIPEKQVEDNPVPKILEMDATVRDNLKVTLTEYTGGVLKGVLTTRANRATYAAASSDPSCITDDMRGVCTKEIPLDMNIVINFEVKVK